MTQTTGVPAGVAPFGRTVLVTTLAGLLVVGQLYVVLPLLAGMAADWHTPAVAATWTATVFGFAYAGGFLLAGPLSDLLGRRRIVVAGLTLMAIATAATALAPSQPVALVCRAVQGLGAAGFSPAALAYLGERIAPGRRPLALTCLVTAMAAATVTGQLVGQALLPLWGWRGVFWVNAAVILALAVALRAVLLPEPYGAGRAAAGGFGRALRGVTRPLLVLIYVAALTVLGGFVAVYTALQLHGPVALTGDPAAFLALRASALPALVAIPFLTPILSRVPPIPRAAGALVVAAVAIAGLAAVVRSGTASITVIGALLFVFVAAIGAVSPGLTELVGVLSGRARGAGVALYTFSLLAGASLGPQLVAAIGPYGLAVTLVVIAAAQLLGGALLLVAHRLHR